VIGSNFCLTIVLPAYGNQDVCEEEEEKKTRQITTLPFLDSMERCDLTSFCEEEKNLSNHTYGTFDLASFSEIEKNSSNHNITIHRF